MPTAHIVTKHYVGDGGLGDSIYERLRSLGLGSGIRCRPRIRPPWINSTLTVLPITHGLATAEYPSSCWTFAISAPRAIRRDAKM